MKDRYRVVYQPNGAAREYSELAANLYSGCPHGCVYCYAPDCLRRDRQEYHARHVARPNVEALVEADAKEMKAANDTRAVLLCFTCDPYPGRPCQNATTRAVLESFARHGIKFQVLTKAGTMAARDFDLYKPGDAFAATLTCDNAEDSVKWEPKAALPADRIRALELAHGLGITTWVSFEPVLDPNQVYSLYEKTKGFVDLYKIGKLNHRDNATDWHKFATTIISMCEKDGKKYIIKNALKAYV